MDRPGLPDRLAQARGGCRLIQSQPPIRPPSSKSLLTFYYHATFFLAAALLGMHTILSLVSGTGS